MTDKFTNKSNEKKGFNALKPLHKAACIALVSAAALVAVCLVTDGVGTVGGGIRSLLLGLFSYGAVIIPIALVAQAVCFAEDLDSKRFLKRNIYALVSASLISTIECAILGLGSAIEFSPVDAFLNMNGGGLIGNIIGFVLSYAFSSLGALILSVMALAIYSVFFFAEKAGSVGQAALNFAAGIKKGLLFVKRKHREHTERKRQIKEDADQHQREASSEELIDDDFFKAKGEASEIKIKKLGIEENASTHGLSPLVDPEKRIPEEPEIPIEPEVKHKRSDKPLDLSYGIQPEESTEASESSEKDKTVSEKFSMGIDDSADSVFAHDFDLFDFATSEKRVAKYASRVSDGSAVTEELDEMTIYRMKADHEPDERELRLMELERKKQEYMRRKGVSPTPVSEPSSASAPVDSGDSNKHYAPSSPVSSEAPKAYTPSTPVSSEAPKSYTPSSPVSSEVPKVYTPSTPVSGETTTVTDNPIADNIPSRSAASSGYTPTYSTQTSRTQPIKTVEFTVSKDSEPKRDEPIESKPVTMTVDKISKPETSDEDIAILISERVAKSNPAYARSANDLKTYTKVIPDGDDELYRQIEGIPSEEVYDADSDSASEIINGEAKIQHQPEDCVSFEDEGLTLEENDDVSESEAPASHIPVDSSDAYTDEQPESPKDEPASVTSVEFVIGDEGRSSLDPAPTEQSSYQRAAGFASAMMGEKPEFKPYTPPTDNINPSPVSTEEGGKLKVERSMLPPTPEAVAIGSDAFSASSSSIEAAAEEVKKEAAEAKIVTIADVVSSPSLASPSADASEIIFTAADDSVEEASEQIHIDSKSESDPIFSPVEGEIKDIPSADASQNDVSFDEDEEDGEEESNFQGDSIPEDECDDEEGEIPPEEQNPDVIKMRGMFNCLDPIEDEAAKNTDGNENAQPEEVFDDQPPFDGGVAVRTNTDVTTASNPTASAPTPSAALVPINEEKAKKKDKPDYSDYKFPSLELLAAQKEEQNENIQAEIQENADKLIETLASFGVTASIKGVDRGPRITRYEVVPAKGVKVSSILNLQDDIALNLAAGSIRMEAPIPGKSAVGIEIPNKTSSIVRLRDLLETPDFESAKSKTFVCIGRDVAGQPVFGDLAKMPHLLIAGATGMGKSVCINSLLISVLYKAKPDEVKLIMIDPKQVEFTMYNGIPHLLVPVVSDAKQAAGALMWAVEEMERRYNLLNGLCSKSVDSYNEKVKVDPSLGEPLPKIIIVIDEFADLMLQVKDPVEHLVTRIAQKARAAGIHLVIGTQRPSVNVITGVIKANIPSRISCKVMSNVDSKTVLDSAGADKLLDKGDALYAPTGSPKPHRLQCAFVDEGEVEVIMDYLKSKSNGEGYDSSVIEGIERAAQKCSKKGGSDRDDDVGSEGSGEGYLNDRQFLDAVEIAVNTRKISTSLIQRKMSIGYGKAAKFIDVMEDMGVVGPANGQRPREVLLTPDEWREKLARTSY